MKRLIITLGVLLGLIGCNSRTAPVNGLVKFKGGSDVFKGGSDVSVLAGYSVAFEAVEGKSSGVGEIKSDGTFKISTFGADDGASPGKYRVAITPPQSSDPDKPPPKSKLAAKYADFQSSGITTEIKPGRNNVTFELDGAP